VLFVRPVSRQVENNEVVMVCGAELSDPKLEAGGGIVFVDKCVNEVPCVVLAWQGTPYYPGT
jgi:hypothetical protein